MKKGRTILVGSVILLTSTFYAFTQLQQPGAGKDTAPGLPVSVESKDPLKNGPPFVYMDEKSFEIISPDGDKEKVKDRNTYEAKLDRWKAALALKYQDEYKRQFPKTAEQLRAEAEAVFAITHPQENYARVRAQMTPEQLQREDELKRQKSADPSNP